MININLESIREYFPKLKRFLARVEIDEIRLIADKHNLSVDIDKVLECLSNCWTVIAFGETHNKFDIEISIESLEETVEWLGQQNIKDTDILMMRMDMIDDLDRMDSALYQLYKVLDDTLLEEEK